MSIKIALAGNPNSGKTTLFNALTGANQFVGNWPGVTVEKKEGRLKHHKDVIITDLPGVYSLSPYTLEEVVARDYLMQDKPDVILNIVDGTNLERNLYLTTQLIELGIPVLVAVNMMDVIQRRGDRLDKEKLGEQLGCDVVEICALKGTGVMEAAEKALSLVGNKKKALPCFNEEVENVIRRAGELTPQSVPETQRRFFAIQCLEGNQMLDDCVENSREIVCLAKELEERLGDDVESIITNERYEYISEIAADCMVKVRREKLTVSDKIDKIATNRVLALPIFAVIMIVVYYVSVTSVGAIATDWMNDGLFGDEWGIPVILGDLLSSIDCAQWLSSLLIDGIAGGVGAVLGFVPQMCVLFLFLAFLESCGYMARVAFIMDRIFRRFGLSGKSFIPMLIASGCGVPGIMASRTIESDRDRRMTIMTTTFIPCGAKLPIIALIAGALFGGAGWVAPSAYFLGILAVIVSGIILKKTRRFTGDAAPFVMELPEYHLPAAETVLRSMWERCWSFIRKAGTIILLSSIVIWVGSVFGWEEGRFGFSADLQLADSILGRFGDAIKWIFAPLGFGEASAAVATIMGLVAKEEVVGVFGVVEFAGLTQAAGYAFLVFNLLCAPCFAAMGAIRREMNSRKWFWAAIGYQCAFAYTAALIIYQFGMLFAGQPSVPGLVAASVLLFGLLYMVFRPARGEKESYGRERIIWEQ